MVEPALLKQQSEREGLGAGSPYLKDYLLANLFLRLMGVQPSLSKEECH